VVTRPVVTPRRSITILVATVVPWPKYSTSAGDTAKCSSISRVPCAIATEGSLGDEGTLKYDRAPLAVFAITKSVKVPPTSMPIRNI
jgi:hypothetical protein